MVVGKKINFIFIQPFDLRDEASLQRVMKYSNVVINLIGRDHETRYVTCIALMCGSKSYFDYEIIS